MTSETELKSSLISILIPAYNHEKFVESCVRSVLAQDWPNIELLVVDDGSTDATWTKLQALKTECEKRLRRVEMVTQENRGTSFTWARLRAMAQGEFILTLASDDELKPGALSALVKPMLKKRKIGVVVGQNELMDGEGRTCYWNRALENVYDKKDARYISLNEALCAWAKVKQFSRYFGSYKKLLEKNHIANGCLIRASELNAIPPPPEEIELEDYWMHLQLAKRTRYKAIREITFRYRWHKKNTSHDLEKMKAMTQRIYDYEERQWTKKTYDLVFGVGNACSCSQAIRAAGLQFASFPFDWNVCPSEDDLKVRADLLCNGFEGWMDTDDFEFVSHNTEREAMDVYRNRRTGFLFLHDFEKGVSFEEAYERVRCKYARRIDRLFAMIRSSRRILIVRVDRPDQRCPTAPADCVTFRKRLAEAFPDAAFNMILLSMDSGRDFRHRREEQIGDGVLRISFDYSAHAKGLSSYLTRSDLTGAALRDHAKVRDYRTREERLAYGRKCRKKTYDLVFGLGPACSCSQTLRKAGLQLLSFPFDWTGYMKDLILYPGDMPRKVDDICAGMKHWFEREDIAYVHREQDGRDIPYNRRTTGIFPHDFHSPEELERNFEKVKAKYVRRISRMLELLRQAKEVLIVRLDSPPGTPPTPDDDCRSVRRKLKEAFPNANFDIIHFRYEKGRPFADRLDREIEPGFREIAFDYHDYTPGKPTYEVKLGETARALCEHAAVRDYRTSAERRQGRRNAILKFLHLK